MPNPCTRIFWLSACRYSSFSLLPLCNLSDSCEWLTGVALSLSQNDGTTGDNLSLTEMQMDKAHFKTLLSLFSMLLSTDKKKFSKLPFPHTQLLFLIGFVLDSKILLPYSYFWRHFQSSIQKSGVFGCKVFSLLKKKKCYFVIIKVIHIHCEKCIK